MLHQQTHYRAFRKHTHTLPGIKHIEKLQRWPGARPILYGFIFSLFVGWLLDLNHTCAAFDVTFGSKNSL
jgi:hypothetical protein